MNEFLQKSLLTMNVEQNKINTLYFSNENMRKVQNQLVIYTRKYTGHTISLQNCSDVLMAMQYFYINYPQYTLNDSKFEENVGVLNQLVVSDLVQQTTSGVKQHLEYLKYIKRTPQPLDYGKSSSIKGENSLEFNSFQL